MFLIALNFAPRPSKKTEKGYEPLDRENSTNIACLYVSMVHSNLSSFLMLYCCYVFDSQPARELYYMEIIAYSHMLGYMIYDMFAHFYNNKLDSFIFFHHMNTVVLFLGILIHSKFVDRAQYIAGVAEITHTFHATRIIFDTINEPKNSKRYLANLFTFGISFLILRAHCSILILAGTIPDPYSPTVVKITFSLLNSLFIEWSIQVFCLLWKSFPSLFADSQRVENLGWWKAGREIMQKCTKQSPYCLYFKACEYSLTVAVPLTVSIYYSFYTL